MPRKKTKKDRTPKYLPGVTWKDAFRKRPVTTADLEDVRRREESKEAMRVDAVCRDCGRPDKLFVNGFRRASPPRCGSCGGILDPKDVV
jgi:hypothetical protein